MLPVTSTPMPVQVRVGPDWRTAFKFALAILIDQMVEWPDADAQALVTRMVDMAGRVDTVTLADASALIRDAEALVSRIEAEEYTPISAAVLPAGVSGDE